MIFDMENLETFSVALPTDMAAEIRAAVQDGIDSGPDMEADAVFARLRARIGQPPAA